MIHYIPQLGLNEDEFDQLNSDAAQANMGLYDYVAWKLVGRTPPGPKPKETQAVRPTNVGGFETKAEFRERWERDHPDPADVTAPVNAAGHETKAEFRKRWAREHRDPAEAAETPVIHGDAPLEG